MSEFLQRLKERKLVQWAIAYVAAAFALLQGIDIVAQRFGWPEVVERGLIIASCIGFFVVLVLAWYHGERGAQRVTGTELLILALLLSLGGVFLWRFASSLPATPASTPTAAVIPVAVSAKSIAVLPFENLSDDKSNAYFAAGIQDEILTRLAKIADLKVISRTSTQRYASAPDNLREVGSQLGVANFLEGSVQKAGQAVHINVQLIKATTDAHLWAESYDRELQDIFGVEGEVAGKIAEALSAKLTGTEAQAIAQKPTTNAAAYDAYLHARSVEVARFDFEGEEQIVSDYATAVRLDPSFALAWARLASVRSFLYFNSVDRAMNSAAAIKEAADRAYAIAPELGEAWMAQGDYRYHVLGDLPGGLHSYEEAVKRLPNSAEAFGDMAFVERRLGRWDAAVTHFKKALQLDPRNLQLSIYTGEALAYLRRFSEANQFIDHALELAPDAPRALLAKITLMTAEGDLAAAGEAAARIKGDSIILGQAKTAQLVNERRFADAVAALQSFVKPANPQAALEPTQLSLLPLLGFCQERLGQNKEAQATYARAVHGIKPTPQTIVPVDQALLPIALAGAYAGLKEKDKALAAAREAVRDYEADAVDKPQAEIAQAQIEAQLGEVDAAIAALPHLLEVPAGLTPGLLRLDPGWDPLRQDPRFQKLVASSPPPKEAK